MQRTCGWNIFFGNKTSMNEDDLNGLVQIDQENDLDINIIGLANIIFFILIYC